MSRTHSFHFLRRCLGRALTILDPSELKRFDTLAITLSRRKFIKSSSALSLLTFASGCSFSKKIPPSYEHRVAIVGGGVAGLTCAYYLQKAGVASTIYEASPRVGGRVFTSRGKLPDQQICELGGEVIDSNHRMVHLLCKEFDLDLIDLESAYPSSESELFFVDGAKYSIDEVSHDFQPLMLRILKLIELAESSPEEFKRIDSTSIRDWLDQQTDVSPRIVKLLNAAYCEEYGLETSQQSLFNLLYMVEVDEDGRFKIFGDSDERYHIKQGNDALVSKIVSKLTSSNPLPIINTSHKLLSVESSENSHTLTFKNKRGEIKVSSAQVAFALPFTMLRKVDLAKSSISSLKSNIIKNLGYGTNAKLMLSFKRRFWQLDHNSNGSVISNNGIQTMWDTSRGQEGNNGVLTIFQGGNAGNELGLLRIEEATEKYVSLVDQIFSGASSAKSKKNGIRMAWPQHPFTLGSYACHKPGQAIWGGIEGEREGNLHFCGEHTSENFQGFIEGAIESGIRVAKEILTA